ncbi:hypothetical protein CN198_14010 [Sinorhizobium meliloti]|uniref:hypothetical protein n=1 Tax=Rhizobium meliloti TaxID=382 RepID=UPI000FD9107E|nr:hypothetical protein [Sinorhizobium meliloti]RVH69177.1 hypothetical protein CN198_14010 [Sinorhizobium meliloti]
MKHRRGIDLVTEDDGVAEPMVSALEHLYTVEVWTHPPEAMGELIETISRSSDFDVSNAAFREAIRQRPGKYLIHMNGRHRMLCELAPDSPIPLFVGRSKGTSGRSAQRSQAHASGAA